MILRVDIKYANLGTPSQTLKIKLFHQSSLNVALKSGCFSLCSFTNKFHFVRCDGVVAFTVCSEMQLLQINISKPMGKSADTKTIEGQSCA